MMVDHDSSHQLNWFIIVATVIKATTIDAAPTIFVILIVLAEKLMVS